MKNKFIGSTLIVAGTTIGGGMLAMPIISAAVGFKAIVLILFGLWLSMCYTALLFVEIYKYTSIKEGFNSITQKYLGNWASATTAICMLALMYALLAAYITGGGEFLTENLSQWLDTSFSPTVGILLFSVIFGAVVSLGTGMIATINNWIFTIKLVFLAIILVLLSTEVAYINLLSMPINQASLLLVLPVIFTSFGFHVNIPSIVAYMDGNQSKLKWVFIIGSAIPLFVYLLWQLVVLGSIEQLAFLEILNQSSSIQGLLVALRQMVQLPIITISFNVFATAALVTSFLGVALGLFAYIADLAKNHKILRKAPILSLLTFTPPIIFAIYYPKGFILALSYAAVPLVFLSLFLPVLLIRKIYSLEGVKMSLTKKICLLAISLLGFALIAIQVGITTGYLSIM